MAENSTPHDPHRGGPGPDDGELARRRRRTMPVVLGAVVLLVVLVALFAWLVSRLGQ